VKTGVERNFMLLRAAALLAIAFAGLVLVTAAALADSTPIGPLPKGPVTHIQTTKGQYVAAALPRATNGRVWRIARAVDRKVLREVSEAHLGTNTVVVFKATGVGTAHVVFAQTRGDASGKALRSAMYIVRVR
jgi:hypothetical protein